MPNLTNYIRSLSPHEADGEETLKKLLFQNLVPKDEILQHLGLFLTTQSMCRIMFMLELYKRIINVPGVILEFGTRYGQNLALFSVFRSIFEPYNFMRRLIGFDTFTGFPSVSSHDGNSNYIQTGNFSTTPPSPPAFRPPTRYTLTYLQN
jgi:hypothetical protein